MGNPIFKFVTSLRLTVACLALGVILVFLGTLAQVDEGLYQAQARWFRSFFIWWGPAGAHWHIPVFPGGYLIGVTLLVNLIAAHIKRFQFTTKKIGIQLTHLGVIVLLAGQLATDLLSRETQMRFIEGQTVQYTESALDNELVFLTDAPNSPEDDVVSVPIALLRDKKEIHSDKLPVGVRVLQFYPNAFIRERGPMVDTGPPPATQGAGAHLVVQPQPEARDNEERNLAAAIIELSTSRGVLGTWLVSADLRLQQVAVDGKNWRVALRPRRYYLPYTVQLLKTTHDVYPGTDIPKNFESRVRIENPARGENREVNIYMNNPLRYEGLTFFQFQMDRDRENPGVEMSALQVVRNPGWITPYLGCVMVGGGMIVQFLTHLVGFIAKRRPK